MSEEAWAQAWETYQRRKKENEERDAFRAGKEDTLFLSSVDVHATDWELADTPDSPCDVP